jgi:AraC-like DNA-binding protein
MSPEAPATLDDLLATLRLSIIKADRTQCGPWWRFRKHQIPYCRLYLLRAGRGIIRHHGREFRMRPGFLYLIPAHTSLLETECPQSMDQCWAHLNARVLGALHLFDLVRPRYETPVANPEHAEALFEQVIAGYCAHESAARFVADAAARLLLAHCIAPGETPPPPGEIENLMMFRRVLAHIEDHLAEPLTLTRLAKVAHLHPTYFSNLFARRLGFSPIQYCLRRRIERAKELLWGRDARLDQIAQQVGFRDVYYFSKMFKRHTGMPPSEYRRQSLERPVGTEPAEHYED